MVCGCFSCVVLKVLGAAAAAGLLMKLFSLMEKSGRK